jgi:RNA recognition motif-containing protein
MPPYTWVAWTKKFPRLCYGNCLCKAGQLVKNFKISKQHVFLTNCCLNFTVNVHMPKDRVSQMHQGYGFVEFMGEDDADYAIKIMNMIKLYGKPIRVNKVNNFLIKLNSSQTLILLRHPLTKRTSTSEQTSSSATWTPKWTRSCCTTRSPPSE